MWYRAQVARVLASGYSKVTRALLGSALTSPPSGSRTQIANSVSLNTWVLPRNDNFG